jgi:hypothetical protein
MNVSYLPPEVLRKSVLDLIAECRKNLKNGNVDISQVESSVRAYCESITALPVEEGIIHREGLHEIMQLVTELGEDLVQARDSVKDQLGKLEKARKAHTAYKKTEGIGSKKGPKDG